MKIVIHSLGLRAGGGKVCVRNLIPALVRQGRHKYVALIPDLPEYSDLGSADLKLVVKPSASRPNLFLREWWLNATVSRLCREERADALLCLGNLVPHYCPLPTVVFLQNAFYVYEDPRLHRGLTRRERVVQAYARHQFRHLSKNVTVIVETRVMKQRVSMLYPIPASRVVVVPDCGPSLGGARSPSDNSHPDPSRPFTFLCVGAYYAHKNYEVLLGAVRRLKEIVTRPFQCLITVDPSQRAGAKKLLEEIRREGLSQLLVSIGMVPHNRLLEVYDSADAFILPTLLESFGRPYGEAMQCCLPILTSDLDFARERCQDAAIYFDPLDPESVARAMAAVMEDGDLRTRLVRNGTRVLGEMPTWDDVAARFVEILERVASGREPLHSGTHSQEATARPEGARSAVECGGWTPSSHSQD